MREQIIKRALEDFIQYGFKTFTMDDLSHKLGMSKKTLYEHFQSKADLAEACLDHVIATENSIDMFAGESNVIENIFANIGKCQESFKINSAKPKRELQKYYPKLYAKFETYVMERNKRDVEELIERGQREGLFREDINRAFFLAFYSTFQHIRILSDNFPETRFSYWETLNSLFEYCLRILSNEQGLRELDRVIEKYNIIRNYNR